MLGINLIDLNNVICRPIDIDSLNREHEKSEIEFVRMGADELDAAISQWQRMATLQCLLADEDPSLAPKTMARPFIFGAFITDKLTTKQVEYINNKETTSVARQCIDLQARVAQVPIQECLEPMQHIPMALERAGVDASFSDHSFPETAGEWAGKPQEFWARASVVKRLVMAGQILKAVDAELHFLEAFRPQGVQEAMFARRHRNTNLEHPEWSDEEILAETKSKTASTPRLASHMGGAAVDVFLQNSSGNLLDFGHNYPDGGALVSKFNVYVTSEQWFNRQLLHVAADLAGLTMYLGEDWHFSFGDNLWVCNTKSYSQQASAKYGPIKDFDHETGEVTAIYDSTELDELFSTI